MSVLECDRLKCDNIMCDKMIDNQYICFDCLSEFREWIGDQSYSKFEWKKKFNEFMESEKGFYDNQKVSFEEFIK